MNFLDINPTIANPGKFMELWEKLKIEKISELASINIKKDLSAISVQLILNSVILDGEEYLYVYVLDANDQKFINMDLQFASQMINDSTMANYLTDKNGKIIKINDKAAEMLGYTQEELLNLCISDIDPTIPDIHAYQQLWESILIKRKGTYKSRHLHKNGYYVPIKIYGRVLNLNNENYVLSYAENISEQKKNEEELIKVHNFFSDNTHPAFLNDSKGNILRINKKACEIMGYSEFELINMNITDIDVIFNSPEVIDNVWQKLDKEKGVHNFQSYHRRKDGSSFPVEIYTWQVEHNGQQYNYGYAIDLSDKQELENKLNLTNYLVENSDIATFMLAEDSRIIQVNKKACELVGYDREELLQMTILDLDRFNHQNEKELHKFQELLAQENQLNFQSKLIKKDGTEVHVDIYLSIVEFEGNRYSLAYIFDLTERKELEKELILTNHLLENSKVITLLMNEKADILRVNGYALESLGYTEEELIGKNVRFIDKSIQSDDYLQSLIDETMRSLRLEQPTVLTRKDSTTFPVNTYVSYIKFENKVYFLVNVVDITEKQKLQEELLLSNHMLMNSEVATHLTNNKGEFIKINRKACEMLGYSEEEFLTLSITDIDEHFNTKERVFETWNKLREVKSAVFCTYQIKKDGTRIPVELYTAIIEYEGQEYNYAYIFDLTEKQQLEKDLFLNSHMVDNASVMAFLIAEDSSFIQINKKAAEELGYTKELLLTKTFCNIENEYSTFEDFKTLWQKIIDHSELTFDVTLKRFDGSLFPAEISAKVVEYQNKTYINAFGVNLTEKKKLEETLLLNAFAVDNSSIMVVLTDEHGQFLQVNKKTVDLLGYSKEELLQMNVIDLDLSHNTPEKYIESWNILKNQKTYTFEANIRKKDATIMPVEISTNYFEFECKKYDIIHILDKTESQKLQDQLLLTQAFFDQSPVAAYIADIEGNMISVNKAGADMLDYTLDELYQKKLYELTPNIGTADKYLRRVTGFEYDKLYQIETNNIKKDGTVIPIEAYVKKISYKNKDCLFGFSIDLSEKKQLEEELLLIQAFFENCPVSSFIIDKKGTIVKTNLAAAEMLGYSKGELLHKSAFDLNPAMFSLQAYQDFANSLDYKEFSRTESINIKKDGSVFPVELFLKKIKYNNEDYIIGFTVDLSEKKQLEEELLLKEAFFDQCPVTTYIIDMDAKIIQVNQAYLEMTGYTFEELYNDKTVHDTNPNYSTPEKYQALADSLSYDTFDNYESYNQRKDGSIVPIDLYIRKIKHKNQDYMIGFAIDLTEQKKRDEELNIIQDLVENSPIDTYVFDRDGNPVYVNKNCANTAGLTVEEYYNKKAYELNHQYNTLEKFRELVDSLDENQVLNFETTSLRHNGKHYPEELFLKKLVINDKAYLIGHAIDLTDKKKLEKDLLLNAFTVETSSMIIVLVNDKGRLIQVNNKAIELLGYSKNELLSMNIFDIGVIINSDEKFKKTWNKYYIQKEILFEGGLKTKSGNIISVEVWSKLIEYEGDDYVAIHFLDISERKRLEEELYISQEIYKNAPISAFILATDGTIVSANNATLDIIGDSLKQNLSLKAYNFCVDFDTQDSFKEYVESLKENQVDLLKTSMKRNDGSCVPVEMFNRRISYENQTYLVGFMIDVTERNALQSKLLLTQHMVDHSSVGVILANKEGKVVRFNNKICEILGYTKDEINEMSVSLINTEFKNKDYWQSYYENMRLVKAKTVESFHTKKDGTIFPAEVQVSYLEFEDESYLIGFITDITKRRALQDNLMLTQHMVDHSSAGVIVAEFSGRVIQANNKICEMFNYTREEMYEKYIYDLDETVNNYDDWIKSVESIKKDKQIKIETLHKRKDGSIYPAEVQISCMSFADKGYIIGFISDITERKSLEENLLKSQSMVENASVGIVLIEPKGKLVQYNKRFADMIGYDHNEMYKLSVTDFDILIDTQQKWDDHYVNMYNHKEFLLETFHKRKDGSIYPAEIHIFFMEFCGKAYIGSFITDISERKSLEENLLLTKTIVENASIGVALVNKEGQFIQVNRKRCEMLGYTEEELLSMTVFDIGIDYIEYDNWYDVLTSVKENNSIKVETFHKKKDGSLLPVETQIFHIEFEQQESLCGFITDISERKTLEENLLLAKTMIENASVGIYLLDKDGNPAQINSKLCEMLGYTEQELMKVNVCDVDIHYNATLQWNDTFKTMKEIKQQKLETIHKRKDGSLYPAEIQKFYVEFGGVGFVCGFVIDITERKTLEEDLMLSQYLVDNSSVGIILLNLEGQIVQSNKKMAEMLGYSIDELSGMEITDIDYLLDSEEKITECRNLIEANKEAKLESIQIRKDGSVFPVEINVSRLEYANNVYYVSFVTDTTDRKEMEKNLKRLEFALENAGTAAFLVRLDGTILYVNRHNCELFGYNKEEYTSLKIMDIDTILHNEEKWKEFTHKVISQKTLTFETGNVRKDGTKFQSEVWVSIFEFDDEVFLVASLTDITQRKEYEAKLKEDQATLESLVVQRTSELVKSLQDLENVNIELQKANKHKDQFLSSMSHELRTPLNAIIGFTELLKKQLFGDVNEKQHEYLGLINTSADMLLSLIDDILDIAKIDRGMIELNYESIALNVFFDEIIQIMQPQFDGKEIKFCLKINENVSCIYADRRRLKQIMLNLLSNALKFTDKKGQVKISVEKYKRNRVKVSVTDNGIGIEKTEVNHIFKEFYQLDQARDQALGGTGIGLSLCKKLIDFQQGKIGVESKKGKGSTFWFILPEDEL